MSRIRIHYCTQCQWLLRSAWYAQQLLLRPSRRWPWCPPGYFEMFLDDASLWERKRDGGFPDIKALKQAVRDRLDPDRSLGHIDR